MATINGTSAGEIIQGTVEQDIIHAGASADHGYGLDGNDVIDGDDTVYDDGDDHLGGWWGNDKLYGGGSLIPLIMRSLGSC